ncbi:uncharacterized protein LOC18441940 isoform X2 [Amborella trichopoda]|nr:uncharacterized protein LOC18441940 isoform X2 [Amborella trichopoda]|eukprot:XP_020527769.1 uncharacterized protein LOC18441940 isoform X2 [Amborella trichopoda]
MEPEIVKKRWLSLLLWQLTFSTIIWTICKTLVLFPFTSCHPSPSLYGLLSYITFELSLFLFFLALKIITSPVDVPAASAAEISVNMAKTLIQVLITGYPPSSTLELRRRAQGSADRLLVALICAISGCVAMISVCGGSAFADAPNLVNLGLRGSIAGIVYGVHFIYMRRWVLSFPVIQRPLYFSFKMGLSQSLLQAIKLSSIAELCTILFVVCLPLSIRSNGAMGKFMAQQFGLYLGTCVIYFCWELSVHLLQVLHTRRCVFAPSQGSAAAETNPSETLIAALEQSIPRSFGHYLAYLDLCMVSESNVDSWRRAAFFEETGDTYKRVIAVCLRPLEQFASRLSEGLEGHSSDKTDIFSQQLASPTNGDMGSKISEAFNDFQLCTWCARASAALTAKSHKEDRFGVAQLTGSNMAGMSTLISCLLAVEACLGKRTHASPAHLMGPTSIRWAMPPRVEEQVKRKRRGREATSIHRKAYVMADVLRTSIYEIVSEFFEEMQAGQKASVLERDWISGSKPLYGTRE